LIFLREVLVKAKTLFIRIQVSEIHQRIRHLSLMLCNPNYSGCRDQEDWGSKPALRQISPELIFKKPNTK
jgi:hypothetical protein